MDADAGSREAGNLRGELRVVILAMLVLMALGVALTAVLDRRRSTPAISTAIDGERERRHARCLASIRALEQWHTVFEIRSPQQCARLHFAILPLQHLSERQFLDAVCQRPPQDRVVYADVLAEIGYDEQLDEVPLTDPHTITVRHGEERSAQDRPRGPAHLDGCGCPPCTESRALRREDLRRLRTPAFAHEVEAGCFCARCTAGRVQGGT